MPTMNRRQFLKVSGAGAIAAAAGPGLMRLAFGQGTGNNHAPLIVVFLRFGCDGLSLVPPTGGADRGHYETARPGLQIPLTGADAALPLANTGGLWGLHPSAGMQPHPDRNDNPALPDVPGIKQLYDQGRMAVVLGAGMPSPVTRSHFDAQLTMELGTPGAKSIHSGWLARHIASLGLPPALVIPAVSAGSLTPTSMLPGTDSITMSSGDAFRLNVSAWAWDGTSTERPPGLVDLLPSLWTDGTALQLAGQRTLQALDTLQPMDFDNYVPANGAAYPHDAFGRQLKMLAQLIKAGVGLSVASIDIGSWDTHTGQSWRFANLVESLSVGLAAFHTDLDDGSAAADTCSVVMSEFGRRVAENDSGGTDHGYGNVMLALGNGVNGGQVYGMNQFAGLAPTQLLDGEDVQVTIDWRQVLAEAMIRRQGNNHLGHVFPGYGAYAPLGIFQGADLPPDYDAGGWDRLFASGFE